MPQTARRARAAKAAKLQSAAFRRTRSDHSRELAEDYVELIADLIDERGLARHRLNTCGYSVGARFAPSWMEQQMFLVGNPQEIQPNMTLFVHTIVLDSDSGTAMTLGQTYLTTTDTPKALSRYGLDFIEV